MRFDGFNWTYESCHFNFVRLIATLSCGAQKVLNSVWRWMYCTALLTVISILLLFAVVFYPKCKNEGKRYPVVPYQM
jgi:hypothetical protein